MSEESSVVRTWQDIGCLVNGAATWGSSLAAEACLDHIHPLLNHPQGQQNCNQFG